VYPLILFICLFIAFLFPWSQRKGLWATILNVIPSPFTEARFRDTFLADIWTSLTKVVYDLAYAFCYFGTGQWRDITMISCSQRWQYNKLAAAIFYAVPFVSGVVHGW
jgi:hypothetical protein